MSTAGLQPWRPLFQLEWGDHPVTPGRLLYLLQVKFGNGLRAAWYRDVVRPRILQTRPVRTNDPTCEIHVLTSAGDWLNLLWALKSFYHFSERGYLLCIHDDGTLPDPARQALREAFPDARIISRTDADRRLSPLLAPFPRCRALRDTNPLSLKVFDFHALLEAPRMMIFDSDLLFFSPPTRLVETLETGANNSLNRDWRDGYTIDPAQLPAELGFTLPTLINSGLGLLHAGSVPLEWAEEFLALPDILSHPHKIEQTLIALCSARFGYAMLPEEYDVHMGARKAGVPMRHYTGPIRHLMYREGMRDLVRSGFLAALAPR